MNHKREISLPSGKHLAVTISFPVEWWTKPAEDNQENYNREYGVRIGAWRLLDVFDRVGVKVTCDLNGIVAELFPALAKEIVKRGHDIAGHGYDQSNPQYLLGPDEERALIQKTLTIIEKVTGYRPKGWVAQARKITMHTVQILAEKGLIWHSEYDLGDVPSAVKVDGTVIIDFPTQSHLHFSDMRFLGAIPQQEAAPLESCKGIVEFFKSQLDAIRGAAAYEPLCFELALHAHLVGRPAYSWVVQEMLNYAKSFSDIWIVTKTELAQYWLENNVNE